MSERFTFDSITTNVVDNLTGKKTNDFITLMVWLNQIWSQTKRFEKYSSEHLERVNELEDTIIKLKEENRMLRDNWFEAEKSYLYDVADISDLPYLDDELKELREEIYGKEEEE
ncbi:MAG: hypothetical protein IJH63_10150 [Methanobrevibacter sp.]|nr:hypothetical protein [Methanosphaera sp.]MBR0371060.1 hypothetical protein [Methanobrevibacter sp.]